MWIIPGVSDREIVSISTSVVVSHNKNIGKNVFLWYKANFDSIRHYISEFTSTFLEVHHRSDSIDVIWNDYKTLCKDCMAMTSQTKSVKQQLPWITRNIKRLLRKKQRKYNLARRANTDDHWRAYYNLKKEVQRLCRASHNNYVPHTTIMSHPY